MSFYLDFHAKDHQSASDQIENATAPECIKAFLRQAISCMKTDQGVAVMANGHLHEGDGCSSSGATIQVRHIVFAKPNAQSEE